MPRYAREIVPGSINHVIARFIDRQYRLSGPAEREAYLAALGRSLQETDSSLLGYALMSTHVHLALRAGTSPPCQWLQPLHTAVARGLNLRQKRLGPVFAGRPTIVVMDADRSAPLLAYLHNNPVRAGVVPGAADSSWTSHGAYLGLTRAPPWLAVEQGLSLGGFAPTWQGRRAFHALVEARARDPRDPRLSGADLGQVRIAMRRRSALPLELGSTVLGSGAEGPSWGLYLPVPPPRGSRWQGDLEEFLRRVAARRGISLLELRARCRRRDVVDARRLAIWTATRLLGRSLHEIAAAVGLSDQAACHLARTGERLLDEAVTLAAELERPQPEPGA